MSRISEARARRVGAGIWFAQNPEVQIGAGVRFGEPLTPAIRGMATQRLEPGRRAARLGVVDNEIEHAKVLTEVDLRKLSFDVAIAFYEARFADLTVDLERRNLEVVSVAAQAAERRRKAGEITDLNLSLARVAVGRARSELAAAQASRATAVGELAALVGAGPDDVLQLTGDLRPSPLTLDALRSAVAGRADIRAHETEARVARAEEKLARANANPDLGMLFAYELDTGEQIFLGGLIVTLPFWNRAQGDRATARAKQRNADLEREALLGSASREVVDAFEAYMRARDAVDVFESDVLPPLADSEQLLQRGVDAGLVAVNDYIISNLEIIVARREHLERQLQLAKAAEAARFVAGMQP